MVAVNGVTNTTSVSVYRQMNSHLNGHGGTKVMPTQDTPDAGYRNMGEKAPVITDASRQYAQKLYEAQNARYLPGNVTMEQAVQNRINNPQERSEHQKALDAVRDIRSGLY
ncbi:hypothetical protein KMP13_03885 [Epibacterium ulvae]|uniref:hypothetical protein n=1 Tax=Epibacterium ulvae TaxID=1156985 RepID=UPI001BFC7DE7|nr:hypothetical protein [Epibacterium ulvae]MBT8153043.1 hypothetical protein [Epibacterium ulvae]